MTETTAPAREPLEQGRPKPPRRGYLVPGIIALVVLALIALVIDVAGLQSHSPSKLVGAEIAQDVTAWAQAQEGIASPTVRCPDHEPKMAGTVFYCILTAPRRGAARVEVTETSPAIFRLKLVPAGRP